MHCPGDSESIIAICPADDRLMHFASSKKEYSQNLIFQLIWVILRRAKLATCVLFLFSSEKIKTEMLMYSHWRILTKLDFRSVAYPAKRFRLWSKPAWLLSYSSWYRAILKDTFAPKSHPRKIKTALKTIKTIIRKVDVVGLRSQRLWVRIPSGVQG